MLYSKSTGGHSRHIIFVHGNSQSHAIWDNVCSNTTLSESFSLTCVDLPGHGNNPHSKESGKDYSLQGMADALKKFFLAHDKVPYVIVCHSLGTNIVAEIAGHLYNCKGIFMVSPDIIGDGVTIEDIFQDNPNITTLFIAHPGKDALDKLMDDQVCNESTEKRNRLEEMYNAADPLVRPCLFTSIQNKEWIDEVTAIKKLNIPVAVIYGDHETLCVTHYLNKTGLQKWRNEIFIVADAGHCVHLDQPEKVTELIGLFCDDCF